MSYNEDNDAEVPAELQFDSSDQNQVSYNFYDQHTNEPAQYRLNAQKRRVKKRSKSDYDDAQLFEVLHKYFEPKGNSWKCTVPDCSSTISRFQLYFMKRHFERCHQSKLTELFPNMISDTKRNQIEMYKLLQNCIELVTINGFPFSILDTLAMKGNFAFLFKFAYYVSDI